MGRAQAKILFQFLRVNSSVPFIEEIFSLGGPLCGLLSHVGPGSLHVQLWPRAAFKGATRPGFRPTRLLISPHVTNTRWQLPGYRLKVSMTHTLLTNKLTN